MTEPQPSSERRSPPELTHELAEIKKLISRLAWRLRLQGAIQYGTSGAVLGIMVMMLLLVLYKTSWLTQAQLGQGTIGVVVFVALSALVGALMRLDPISLAQRIDRSHGLHDRLSSALAFAHDDALTKSEFAKAQIADAQRHLGGIELKRAAPFERPRDLMPLAIFAVALVLIGAARAPSHQQPLPPAPVFQNDRILSPATVELERDRLEELREELKGVDDPEAKLIVAEIDRLLKDVEDLKITEREFLDRLDKLDERLAKQEKNNEPMKELMESVADKLKEAAEELEKEDPKLLANNEELKQLVDSLKNKDMAKASDAMNKLAEKLLDKDKVDPKDIEQMAKLMEKFADKIDPNDPKLRELAKKHEDVIKKLMEKFDKKGKLSAKEEQSLKRAKEELAKLQEQMKGQSDSPQGRQLQQLQRDVKKMADQMKEQAKNDPKGQKGQKAQEKGGPQQGKPQPNEKGQSGDQQQQQGQQGKEQSAQQKAGDAAKQAAKQMAQGGQEQKKQEIRKMAQRQLDEMRESMKRDGKGDSKDGEQRQEKLRDFMKRAGKQDDQQGQQGQKGQQGQQGQQGKEGQDGKDGKQGQKGQGKEGQGEQGQQGQGKQGQQPGQSGEQPGGKDPQESNKAGQGAGDRDLGEENKLDSKRVDQKVDPELKGKGPSRSEIIKGASEEGFANRRYKEVYGDYSSVVEEVMEKEKVPKGYRFYIKRYFQLIKPREQE